MRPGAPTNTPFAPTNADLPCRKGFSGFVRVAVAIGATATLFACSSQAIADVDLGTENGITYVSDQTPIDPNQPAAPTADCPPGTELVGAGADPVSNDNRGVLSSLRPEDSFADATSRPDDGVTAFAFNTIGETRFAFVWAFCAPGKTQYPSKHRILPLGETRTTKVPCPGGTRVLSGGVALDGLNSDTHLDALLPFDDGDRGKRPDDGWKVKATNVGGADKQFTAWAFCRGGVPVDYPPLATNRQIGPSTDGGDNLLCPNQTHSLVGGGAQILGSPSTRRITGAAPSDLAGEPGTVPDDLLFATVQNNSGAAADFGIHPICARFP